LTKTADYTEAKDKLRKRGGEATKGRITISMERKALFFKLAALVEKDYELNGYRSSGDKYCFRRRLEGRSGPARSIYGQRYGQRQPESFKSGKSRNS